MNVTLDPKISVQTIGIGDRTLGGLLDIELAGEPTQVEQDLVGDVFHGLYGDHQLRTPADPSRESNSALMRWAQQNNAWTELKGETTGNIPATLTGTEFVYQLLSKDDVLQNALNQQQQIADQLEQADAGDAMAEALRQLGQQEQAQAQQANADAQRAQAAQAAQAMQETLQQATGSQFATGKLVAGLQDAKEAAGKVAATMAGWGMGSGSAVRTNLAEAKAFLTRYSAKIQQIADVAGRARTIATSARKKDIARGRKPASRFYSQDPQLVLASELALMSDAAPEAVRMIKRYQFAQRGALARRRISTPDAKGDFVFACDGSGSMGGTPEIYAKGIGLGMAQCARNENRRYHLFTFSSDDDPMIECSSEQGWGEHLDWAEQIQHGGTSFNAAILHAIELMDTTGESPDLVIATDGIAPVSADVAEQWTEFAARTGARMFVVAVNVGSWGTLERLADRVISVSSFESDADALSEQIGKWMQ